MRDYWMPLVAAVYLLAVGSFSTAAPGPITTPGTLSGGGIMNSGSVIDVNGGYIYDSTDSLAVGGVCTDGVSGDVCVNTDLYTGGWVSSALFEASAGVNVQDSQWLQFGDVFQYAMYYNTAGANAFYFITTDGDGVGTNQLVFYVLQNTEDVLFSGELEVDGVGSGASQQLVCVKSDGNLGTCSGGVGGGTCTCG